jgi:murein endopeptidase
VSLSRSVGMPNRGRLVHARRLPTHSGYVIRDRARAWGTDETIDAIVRAFDAVGARHPRGPRIEVHDLSTRHGGPINDHRSHESGRDVDLALYRDHCARGVCDFRRIGPAQLDAARQWALLRPWLERNQVEAIFLDYRLQEPLWREARQKGATADQLRRWFQYPNGPGHPLGVIRHFRKHDDHLHVRFVCHASDPECVSLRPLRTAHASR